MRSLLCALALCVLSAAPSGPLLAADGDAPAPPSLIVLNSTAKNGALSLGGENRLAVHKGDIAVNSSHTMALSLFNSELEVLAGEVILNGGAHILGEGSITPEPITGAELVEDPYTAQEFPEVTDVIANERLFISEGEVTLEPGVYYGGLTISGEETKVTLSPGTYLIVNGDFAVLKAELTGEGITLLVSGDKPGKFVFGNGSRTTLSAPEEGPLKGMLLATDGRIDGANSNIGFNDAKATLTGAVYAPQGRVGVFFKSEVTAGRIVCFEYMMNTGAQVDLTGEVLAKDEKAEAPAG